MALYASIPTGVLPGVATPLPWCWAPGRQASDETRLLSVPGPGRSGAPLGSAGSYNSEVLLKGLRASRVIGPLISILIKTRG